MAMVGVEEWRNTGLREQMVRKIEEAIQHSGTPVAKTPIEMEAQVFSKAKTRDEYLSFVARLILHIKEINNKNAGGMMGMQNAGKGPGPGQVNMGHLQAGQGNMNMMNQGGMGMMNQQGMMNPNLGSNQNTVSQVNSMMPQQTQQMNNQQSNQGQMMGQQSFIQQNQLQNVQLQNPNMGPSMQMHSQTGMMNQQMQNVVQIQGQQLQGQGGQMQPQQMQTIQMQDHMRGISNMQVGGMQMQNPNQVLGNTLSNPSMGGGVNTMGIQNPMGNVQFQNQQINMFNSQIPGESQLRSNVQHMTGSNQQIHPGQIQGQMPMQNMMNSAQQQVNRPGGPGQMGTRMMGASGGIQSQMNKSQPHHRMHRPPSMENLPIMGNYNSSNIMSRGAAPSQFAPNPAQGMGQTPSPGPPNQIPTYVGSPGQPSRMPSPATAGMATSMNLRSFPGHGVPSPQSSLNTPASMATPSPGPRSVDDQACQEKIKELRRYIDLLQRMIAKIGNDDLEKTSKMKKLLEILTNPNQRVSMDILLKCEAALKKMEKQQNDAGMFTTTPQPSIVTTKDSQVSPFQQLMDSLLNLLRVPSSSHTLLRTFKPTVEALSGHSCSASAQTDDDEGMLEVERKENDLPPLLKREIRTLDSRFKVCMGHRGGGITRLTCILNEVRLPKVPPLKINVRNDYPFEPPVIVELTKDYTATSFLLAVARALKSRLLHMPKNHSVIELLYLWEMCVRQASNPNPKSANTSAITASPNSAILNLGL